MNKAKAFGWITGIAGLWEILAPFILGYSSVTGGLVDALILGSILLILGLWTALAKSAGVVRTLSWIDGALGLWLILAPFLVSYSSSAAATANDIIIGAIVLVFSVWGAFAAGQEA